MKPTLIAFFHFLTLAAATSLPADFIPQIFDRDTADGGWALSQGTCPRDSPVCGSKWCCPSSTKCVPTGGADIAEVCCPGSIDCLAAFQAGPKCADTTWSLWNSTTDVADAYGYFCCLPGQVGMQNGGCVTPDLISSPTQTAVLVAAGASASSTAAAASSSSSSATPTSTIHTGTTTTAVTTASTTQTTAGTATDGGNGLGVGSTVSGSQASSSPAKTSVSSPSSTSTARPANDGARVQAGGLLALVMGLGAWALL